MKKAASAVVLLLITLAVVPPKVSPAAPTQDESREVIRERMMKFFGYVGLEKATPAEVDEMVELWSRAARPGLSADERTAAFRELYTLYAKLQGVDYDSSPQAAAGLSKFAATSFQGGARLDLRLPEPRG